MHSSGLLVEVNTKDQSNSGRDSTPGMRPRPNHLLSVIQVLSSWVLRPADDGGFTTFPASYNGWDIIDETACSDHVGACGFPLVLTAAGTFHLATPLYVRVAPVSSTSPEPSCNAPFANLVSGRDSTPGMRPRPNHLLFVIQDDLLHSSEEEILEGLRPSGGFLEVVRRGLAPPSEPRPFQVPSGNREAVAQLPPTKKPEVAACPPPQRGGTGAPPTQRDRLSNDMPALITRSPPRRKERAARPKPLEEPSTSKEQQAPPAASTVSPEEERMDVSESPPIHLAPPDDSKLKKSSQKKPIPRVTPPKPPEGV
ncbi:hypothetical protein HPB47_002490 [Ixodes persulcatus]|uniref:Uncharacterized protein n=1 Tax=Ixodes persulcatus TaxID=34615 RepID=A0AC60PLG9_IXOPE|nr:hypothetical protein HPB47_002490 [Ixodes persulcatus]